MMKFGVQSESDFKATKELAIEIMELFNRFNADPHNAVHALELCASEALQVIANSPSEAMQYVDGFATNVRSWILTTSDSFPELN